MPDISNIIKKKASKQIESKQLTKLQVELRGVSMPSNVTDIEHTEIAPRKL